MALLLLLFWPSVAAQECACAAAEAPCAAYWLASTVFVGRVESIARERGGRRVTYAVVEGFRGVSSSTVDVVDAASERGCWRPVQTGREYFVYASRGSSGSALTTRRCSRAREVEDAAADLAYVRGLADGSAAGGRITGQVLLGHRDLHGKTTRAATPLEGIVVRSRLDAWTDTAATNRAGDFALPIAARGEHTVLVEAPDRFYTDTRSTLVELRDARACANVDAILYDNGVVSGRVVDAAGRAVAGLTVEIATANLSQRKKAITGRDGRYEIAHLPAGRFVVGLNTGPQPVAAPPQPRIFHPGVDRLAAASRVLLSPGERVLLDDLRLPASVKYAAISGFVLEADGTPAEGARVYLKGTAEGAPILAEPAVADFLGGFVIAAPAGADYLIFAERTLASRPDSTAPLQVSTSAASAPLRLVLRRRY